MKPTITLCAALQLSSVALAQTTSAPAPVPAPAVTPTTTPVSGPTPTNEPPVDYPGAIWAPAAEGNFNPQNRPTSDRIDMIVVHDIEGPASAAINIFQRKGAGVSAHYIVGGDGQIYQMVREHNVGWHAGNRSINHRSIGIETEGYAYRPGWFSPTIYEAEAKLVRDITKRYGIPRDRTHIIAHAEVPNPRDPTKFGGGSGHTDPGPYWNWATFMTLVRNDARLVEAQIPATIRPGEVLPVSVTMENTGDDLWPANTAKNPKTALQASGPIVVLGTEGSCISPLYNLQGWIGPAVAAGAVADTLPGTRARFDFTLRGPRTLLGAWNDSLRLTTMPTAAQGGGPISFGDKVSLSTRVVPWVIYVPTADVAADAPTGGNAPLAKWSVSLPIGGIYAVYASPPKPAKTRGEKPFSYQITSLEGSKTVQARPQDGGKGMLFAGYFKFAEPSKTTPAPGIELQSAPRGVVASGAGGVRLIGPFPTLPGAAPDLSQIPEALNVSTR